MRVLEHLTGTPTKCTAALVVLGAACLTSCKKSDRTYETAGEESAVVGKSSENVGFYADSTAYLEKNSEFYFKVWDESFTRKLADLPQEGSVPEEKKPYSGAWYPEQGGGTNVRVSGSETPLEKYDAAFHGGSSKAQAWEVQKHTSGPPWAGHCNGFAAAAQRHPKEPEQPVTRDGVTFTPYDIKALMAEIYMSAKFAFLGGNRCENSGRVPGPDAREDPTVMGPCEDVNPGTLHAAVTNWIGRKKHTLLMDEHQRDQVWNYPYFSYEITTQREGLSEAEAKRFVSGNSGEYDFNPNAQSFAYVEMRLDYANALNREQLDTVDDGHFNLTYILELDGQGRIIGGEWTGQSVRRHPDFIWIALEPQESNGTRYMGNPHVDPQTVIELWAESAGYDPEDFPEDIKQPVELENWGKWPGFEVTLDGSRRGAVFGGKKTILEVERRGNLTDASLNLSWNGGEPTRLTAATGEPLTHEFSPGPGLHRLDFSWEKNGSVVKEESLSFHKVP